MVRRNLFSIMFGTAESRPLTQEEVGRIDMSPHLKTELTTVYTEEVAQFSEQEKMPFLCSKDHSFSIAWSLDTFSKITTLCFGTNQGPCLESHGLSFGLHLEGYLYIGDVRDQRKLKPEQLKDSKLRLDVTPLQGGAVHAKLVLTDGNGLTIAMVKTAQYNRLGGSNTLFNIGPGVKRLEIEGRIKNTI